MGYKIKRGSHSTEKFRGLFATIMKRILGVLVLFALVGLAGYFVYQNVPTFAESVDNVWGLVMNLYQQYGLWVTIGVVVLVVGGIWVLSEEMREKEAKKKYHKEWMK